MKLIFLLIPLLFSGITVSELPYYNSDFITINGTTIHYREWAGTSDTTLILLHGFGAHTFSFDSLIERLPDSWHIIAYDRPGFGFTKRTFDNVSMYSYEKQSHIIKVMLDSLHIDNAIIGGHSAGGYTALLFAKAYPDRVKSLILLDASFFGRQINPFLRWLISLPLVRNITLNRIRSLQDAGLDIIYKSWYDKSKITDITLFEYQRPLECENWDKALYYLTIGNNPPLSQEDFQQMDYPVLIISGKQDSIIPCTQSIENARYFPNAHLHIIDSCGHIPQEERPDKTSRLIIDFIRSN